VGKIAGTWQLTTAQILSARRAEGDALRGRVQELEREIERGYLAQWPLDFSERMLEATGRSVAEHEHVVALVEDRGRLAASVEVSARKRELLRWTSPEITDHRSEQNLTREVSHSAEQLQSVRSDLQSSRSSLDEKTRQLKLADSVNSELRVRAMNIRKISRSRLCVGVAQPEGKPMEV